MESLLPHYRHIEKRLRRLLRREGRSLDDADDLIQESLLRLHEYSRSREVRDGEAFLLRTVKNLVIDRHRRAHRHLYAPKTLEELELSETLADERPGAEQILSAQGHLQMIEQALEAISPRTRDVYFAHRAGYSYAEIGAHLGISSSTIEKHIARAVLALMDLKEPE